MNKIEEDTRYSYAIGRVRAREAMLFDRNRYEQLIMAENDEVFMRNLANSPYSEFQKMNLTEILNEAKNENIHFFKKYCLEKNISNLLVQHEDVYNLKILLKTELINMVEPEQYFSSLGTIPIENLKDTLRTALSKEEKVFRNLIPEFIKKGIARAINVFNETNNPTLIDIEIEKVAMNYFISLTQINNFLNTFYRQRIDLENIRTFLRIMIFKDDSSIFSQAFIPGGLYKYSFYKELPTDSTDAIIERFSFTPYRFVVNDGVQYLMNINSFLRYERLASEHILLFFRRARYFTFGFEPLIGYFFYKENEIRNLRKIYYGIMSKVNKDQIRESVAYA